MPGKRMRVEIAIESVERRTFAIACGWPGWARSGGDEDSAIKALCEYGPRYAAVFRDIDIALLPPQTTDAFIVVEHLQGNSTTAFGAPAMLIQDDLRPVTSVDLARLKTMMTTSWNAFDRALAASEGIELRKGPRGGGRNQEKMTEHVIMADESYLSKLGWKFKRAGNSDQGAALMCIREAMLEGLEASIRGELPAKGPRGGARWTPRFFVRRVIWHILDHTWEIEDRVL